MSFNEFHNFPFEWREVEVFRSLRVYLRFFILIYTTIFLFRATSIAFLVYKEILPVSIREILSCLFMEIHFAVNLFIPVVRTLSIRIIIFHVVLHIHVWNHSFKASWIKVRWHVWKSFLLRNELKLVDIEKFWISIKILTCKTFAIFCLWVKWLSIHHFLLGSHWRVVWIG